MRLYSRMNAVAHDHPGYDETFKPNAEDGGFDFPDDVADELHRFHHRGKPAWETADERDLRLHGEESARRRDPEALYNAVADIANLARQAGGQQAAAGLSPEMAAELAQLRKELAELREANAAQGADDAPSDGAPAKPSRSASKAAKAAAESSGGNS